MSPIHLPSQVKDDLKRISWPVIVCIQPLIALHWKIHFMILDIKVIGYEMEVLTLYKVKEVSTFCKFISFCMLRYDLYKLQRCCGVKFYNPSCTVILVRTRLSPYWVPKPAPRVCRPVMAQYMMKLYQYHCRNVLCAPR